VADGACALAAELQPDASSKATPVKAARWRIGFISLLFRRIEVLFQALRDIEPCKDLRNLRERSVRNNAPCFNFTSILLKQLSV
jgi:hypothetical protein